MVKVSKNSVQAWLICLLAAMFFFAESVRVNLFDTVSSALMQQFHINAYAYGKLSATYLLANILLLFPAGIILDKFQTRYVLFIALLVTTLSTFAFYHTDNFLLARILMFLTGAGGAFCFIGAMRLAAQWFTSNKLAFVMAIVVTLGMIGGLCAQYPMQQFIMTMGTWQAAYKLIIGIEIVVAILILIFVRNYSHGETDSASVSSFFLNLKKVLRNKQIWVAGLYTSLLNLPITLLGAIWGQLFLVQARHFDQMTAASISSLLFLGMMFGAPFSGWWSDRMQSRSIPMYTGAILSLIAILAIMFIPITTFAAMAALFFLLGLVSSTQALGYAVVSESNSSTVASTAMGLAGVIVMCGGTFLQPFFGWILSSGNSAITHVYSEHNFTQAFFIFPVAFGIAVLLPSFLKQKKQ